MHRLTRFAALLGACAALLLPACDMADFGSDPDCVGGKCDSTTGNGSIVATTNGNADLLVGYHSLFDRTAAQCAKVDKDLARGAEVAVGSVSETFELSYVESREELARELAVDLGLKVKFPTVSSDAAVNLLHKFKSTTTTVNLLLKLSQEYSVRNRHPLMITDAGQSKLDAGIGEFVQTCGTNYINGVRFGGHLYLLITLEASNEESALDLKADLGLAKGGVGTSVDVDLKTRLNQVAKRSDVRTTVQVSSTGFTFGGQKASSSAAFDLLGGEINESMFQRIDEIRGAMRVSVDNDACRDAGEGSCDGIDSPGYYDNSRREAGVRGVEIGFYDALPNLEKSGDPFVTMHERLLLVERYIRDWAELEERMEVTYRNEIEPFLDAPSNLKASYQVAPPADARFTPTDVLAVANQWMDDFFPQAGPQIGWAMQRATQAQVDCWTKASSDLFFSCREGDQPADQSPEWQEVLAQVDAYAAEGRVLPLQYKAGEAVIGSDAAGACADLSTSAISYRLPTFDEVERLAPLVAFGNLTWPGDGANEVWFQAAPGSNGCTDPDFPFPFYEHEPGSAPVIKCAETTTLGFGGRDVLALCVPSSGPMPLVEAP